jgi:hypothetical protein
VTGGWRILYTEEFHNFILFTIYYQGDQVKEDEVGGTCRTHTEIINTYKILVRRHRQEDNIKVNIKNNGNDKGKVVPVL